MSLRRRDTIALERYRLLCDRIAEFTAVDLNETPADKKRRIETLQKDYRAFTRFYFPHYCRDAESGRPIESANFHVKAANQVRLNPTVRLVAMWARAHAKSTHFNIMIPLWIMYQDLTKPLVMVLVGKGYDSAKTLLSDIQAEFTENKLLQHDIGFLMSHGNWEEGRFATKNGCAFFALGRGQSPRGLRHRASRPNYVVMDDVDDDELVRNPDRVRKAYDWALQALMGCMDMGRGRFIVVGNKIATDSLISRFTENSKFDCIRINALDSKGRPSWPEKYTAKQINELIETIGHRRASAEMFNEPIVEGSVFKQEWIQYGEVLSYPKYEYTVSYCDPSFKNTSTSDYKAIVTIGKTGTELHIIHCFVRKCSINELVRHWYTFHESLHGRAIIDYFMEANFIQDLIFDEFVREGVQRGYQLPLRKDNRSKPDKFARIEALSPLFERGFVKINRDLKNTEDCKQLVDQLLSFEKGSRVHDDGPDALEGAIFILNQRTKRRADAVRSGKYLKSDKRRM